MKITMDVLDIYKTTKDWDKFTGVKYDIPEHIWSKLSDYLSPFMVFRYCPYPQVRSKYIEYLNDVATDTSTLYDILINPTFTNNEIFIILNKCKSDKDVYNLILNYILVHDIIFTKKQLDMLWKKDLATKKLLIQLPIPHKYFEIVDKKYKSLKKLMLQNIHCPKPILLKYINSDLGAIVRQTLYKLKGG